MPCECRLRREVQSTPTVNDWGTKTRTQGDLLGRNQLHQAFSAVARLVREKLQPNCGLERNLRGLSLSDRSHERGRRYPVRLHTWRSRECLDVHPIPLETTIKDEVSSARFVLWQSSCAQNLGCEDYVWCAPHRAHLQCGVQSCPESNRVRFLQSQSGLQQLSAQPSGEQDRLQCFPGNRTSLQDRFSLALRQLRA